MSEERTLIAETCDRLFATHLTKDVFGAAEHGLFPEDLWKAISENGLDRIVVSEANDGSGLTWEYAHVVLLAAGWHAAPVPLAEAIAAGWLLDKAGMEMPAGITTLAMGMHDGSVSLPWGKNATHAVADDGGLQCIPLDGMRLVPDRNIGRDPRDAIEGIPAPRSIENQVQAAGALVRSCQMAGALSAVLDLCVEYANARVQFGRPIGRFQAIQQQLAVMAGEAAAADVAAREACRAVDRGGDFFKAIAAAKIRAGEAAGKATNIAHQVHGAIGFTDEYHLHHLTRRLWAWRSEFGSENDWSRWLGARVIARGSDNLWLDLTDGT